MFTGTSAVLAAVGHHLASEDPVPWLRLLVASAVVLAIVSAGAGKARSWWPVAGATAVTQVVLHTALSSSGGPAAVHHGETHGAASAGYAAHHSATTMSAAHLLAAGCVAVLMHRADRRLSDVPHDVGGWAGSLVAAVATAVGRRGLTPRSLPRPSSGPPPVPYRQSTARTVLAHVLIRRGPPEGRVRDVPLNPADRARRA
ncbi:hypothetical protein ACFUN8_14950 [Streptomyces sp. NPDC057307]|uniref:hypothetical protein n=1 Tax=Streptomyces sp. NPDC057307 TaxID=3346096 RepID=UPI003644114A